MPRQSADHLATVALLPCTARPLPPPPGISRKAAGVWRATVAAVPADHLLQSDAVILERYCAAVVRARVAETELKKHGHVVQSRKTGTPVLSPWVSVLAQAERTIATCARALRLTVQSRRDPKTAGRGMRNYHSSAYDAEDLDE